MFSEVDIFETLVKYRRSEIRKLACKKSLSEAIYKDMTQVLRNSALSDQMIKNWSRMSSRKCCKLALCSSQLLQHKKILIWSMKVLHYRRVIVKCISKSCDFPVGGLNLRMVAACCVPKILTLDQATFDTWSLRQIYLSSVPTQLDFLKELLHYMKLWFRRASRNGVKTKNSPSLPRFCATVSTEIEL